MPIVLGLLALALVCGTLEVYAFDQVVNPPRCGSEEVIFSCHGDLWYHLVGGAVIVVVGLVACLAAVTVAFRLRVVRAAKN